MSKGWVQIGSSKELESTTKSRAKWDSVGGWDRAMRQATKEGKELAEQVAKYKQRHKEQKDGEKAHAEEVLEKKLVKDKTKVKINS